VSVEAHERPNFIARSSHLPLRSNCPGAMANSAKTASASVCRTSLSLCCSLNPIISCACARLCPAKKLSAVFSVAFATLPAKTPGWVSCCDQSVCRILRVPFTLSQFSKKNPSSHKKLAALTPSFSTRPFSSFSLFFTLTQSTPGYAPLPRIFLRGGFPKSQFVLLFPSSAIIPPHPFGGAMTRARSFHEF